MVSFLNFVSSIACLVIVVGGGYFFILIFWLFSGMLLIVYIRRFPHLSQIFLYKESVCLLFSLLSVWKFFCTVKVKLGIVLPAILAGRVVLCWHCPCIMNVCHLLFLYLCYVF